MQLIYIVAPVFLIVLTGWLFSYLNIIQKTASKSLIEFVYYVAAPALIFYTIQKYDMSELFVWKFWIGYPLVIALTFLLSYLVFYVVMRKSHDQAFFSSLCSSVANTVMLGYPVLYGVIGVKAVLPMTITVVIFNVFMNPLLIAFLELRKSQHISFYDALAPTLYSVIKNPFILATTLGLFFSILDIRLPQFLAQYLDYLAVAVIPVALFSVGIDMMSFNHNGQAVTLTMTSVIVLLVRPIIALFVSYFLDMSSEYSISLVILSSVPTAKVIYIFAVKYDLFASQAAAIITVTSIAAIVTVPLVLYICEWVWPGIFASLSTLKQLHI